MSEWYAVRIWRTWGAEDEEVPPDVEEAVLLFQASSKEHAIQQASRVVKEPPYRYKNVDDVEISVRGVGVGSVWYVASDEIESGIEIFSQLYETDSSGNITPEWFNGRLENKLDVDTTNQ